MDQNNQLNPNTPVDNSDLHKQYQDILDRYSKELSTTEPTTPIASPVETQPEPLKTLAIAEPIIPASLPLAEVDTPLTVLPNTPVEETVVPVAPVETPQPISEPVKEMTDSLPVSAPVEPSFSHELPPQNISPPTDSYTPPVPETPVVADLPETPSSGGGFFKILFFLSLVIFLGVFGTIAYSVFFKGQLPQLGLSPTPTASEEQPTPTITSEFCDVNDKIVKKGDTFPAADGCNTCSCGADLTISCTDKACDATKSSSISPTAKPSTSSANKSNTSNTPVEIGDFPVYANAQFIKKTPRTICQGEQGTPDSPCRNDSYEFTVQDSFANVQNWYMNTQKSLWKCSGGAGAIADKTSSSGSGVTSCVKGSLSYFLSMDGNNQTTKTSILVPVK